MSMTEEKEAVKPLQRSLHANYFLLLSHILPDHYIGLDSSKMSAIYFIVVALDLLGSLNDQAMCQRFVDGIYHYLLLPQSESDVLSGKFGFISGSFMTALPSSPDVHKLNCADNVKFQQGHLAMIYTALASLLTLGDDLSRVDVPSIAKGLKLLQCENGAFKAYLYEGEADMRFLFCACAIAKMLNLWESVDKDRAVSYIRSCITYEGGFSLTPNSESHGGAVYTALASLVLMERLDSALTAEERGTLVSWCLRRQNNGFEGRTNKAVDSCYAFWIGASLAMLGVFDEVDVESTNAFILGKCQVTKHTGGFRKFEDCYPDMLHSFYSVCWLALSGSLKPLHPALAIPLDKAK